MTQDNPAESLNPSLDPADARTLQDDAETIKGDVRQLGDHLRDAATHKYQEFQQTASVKAQEYRRQAEDLTREYRDKADQTVQQYYRQGQETLDQVEQYVREQPVKSLLIAAGVGLLVGVLYKRS